MERRGTEAAATYAPDPRITVEAVRKLKTGNGWDAQKGEYTDMSKAGIIDPAKVTSSALENAASVAALLLTTETIVTDLPEKDKAPMPGVGGGGMDY